ncbi:hypothetical protein BC833DRAFT_95199 [Globomyces pollinis-pini]|nr:hypothetical protein BC833DRAFT_95199 [Globomyces pollinis-pini]
MKRTFTEGSEKQHEGDGSKQMAEIITYLRREKEIVQTKLLVVNQENDRLKVSLEQLQRSLDENQLILNQEREKNQSSLVSEDKYKELLSKLEHTHLLRESNITLRAQTESLRAQIAQLENTIAEGELKVGPLEERVSQLTAEVEVRVMECKSLTEDNIRWKGRAQQILEKYERIDPVEHEQLKANLAELLQKNETMSKSFETLQSTLLTTENRIKEKDIQIKEFQRKVEEIEKEKAKVIQSKDAEIELLRNPGSNQELVALQARLTASQQKNRDIVEKANVKLIERNSTIKGLKEEIEKEKSKLSLALESALKEQAAKLSREKERELKQLKTDIQTHWERKLSSLESSLEQQRGVILEQTQMLVSSTEREKEDDQVDLSDNPGTPLGNLAENDESDNSATKRLRESGVEELEGESSFTPAAKRMKTDNIDEKTPLWMIIPAQWTKMLMSCQALLFQLRIIHLKMELDKNLLRRKLLIQLQIPKKSCKVILNLSSLSLKILQWIVCQT